MRRDVVADLSSFACERFVAFFLPVETVSLRSNHAEAIMHSFASLDNTYWLFFCVLTDIHIYFLGLNIYLFYCMTTKLYFIVFGAIDGTGMCTLCRCVATRGVDPEFYFLVTKWKWGADPWPRQTVLADNLLFHPVMYSFRASLLLASSTELC